MAQYLSVIQKLLIAVIDKSCNVSLILNRQSDCF